MNKLYHKYQVFYLIIATAFFGYALFFYIQNSNTEKNSTEQIHLIVDKRCSAAPRINSFVQIKKDVKIYTIDLSEQECVNYSVGDKIALYYNEKYDYFFIRGRDEVGIYRIIISGIAFLLLLLPWKYFSPSGAIRNYFKGWRDASG